MIQLQEVYWLAGLIEGEGCFSNYGKAHVYPMISIKMTDKDVIEKAARILKSNALGPYKRRDNGLLVSPILKDTYNVSLTGIRAIGWMMILYPLMCERRQSKIKELLNGWQINGASTLSTLKKNIKARKYSREWRRSNLTC